MFRSVCDSDALLPAHQRTLSAIQRTAVERPQTRERLRAALCGWLILALGALPIGCGSGSDGGSTGGSSSGTASGSGLKVVATTGMIGDTVKAIVGDRMTVHVLMGPGVDPHLFQPAPQDQLQLRGAKIIFHNGLHLEGKLADTLQSLNTGRQVIAVSRDIPQDKLLSGGAAGLHDPHIWFDLELWQTVTKTIAEVLIATQPEHAAEFEQGRDQYLSQLADLHQYCQQRVAQLPEPRRVLITSHDAFRYLGRAYGLEVLGIQGISTETEAGLRKITDLADLIKSKQVPAVFPESSVPHATIERLARDSGAKPAQELYSDALGAPDSPAGTYLGMVKENIERIVTGLGGPPPQAAKAATDPTPAAKPSAAVKADQ